MRIDSVKKYVIPNIPYLFILWACLKLGTAYRLAPGADFAHKLMGLGQSIGPAFADFAPGLAPFDWLIGIVGAVGFRLLIYFKSKNAKKFRRDEEYGSARWGTEKDIKPFVDPKFENNVILTKTEFLTMNTRPKNPANARNLNACIIGSSGSGKTRFWLTPQLLQAHSSYVCVDPKGGVLSQVGAFLQRRGYQIKVFNSIDFSKSMHYNPLSYIHNEADILKFVDTLIANTKGEGKEGDPFWTKAETLLYCALIAYIIFEAPAEDRNINTLVDMISGMDVKEDDESYMNAVDYMMFIVWGLVAILMIVLNMIEVIRRQKEVVVRASLGENAAVIALKAVVADMISYAALFVLAKLLVSQFISGAYEDHLILAVYCAGAVLSVIPYAAFVRFDVKKAFANASDKKGMFYLLNGLKVFATAMTIFTITTNLSSIQGNLLTNTTLLENHYNDYYFGVMQIEPPFEENEEESKESKFWNDLYENEYNTINPVVCIGSRISDTDNYIFVNHNARDMLQGFSDMLTEDDEKEDIVVFVPKGRNAESYKDIAKEEIDSLTQNAEELRVVYKEYSGREQFYYLNSNREEAIDGLSRATNPIVIYQANEAVALNGSYIETGTYNGEVIYGCDESTIRNAAKKYAEQLGSHYFMLTNVGEDYIYSHSFLVKLIGFISSLCVLVLLLDIAIIISEVKMEFRLNAMEISLKKVLGYRFYERHKRFISVNLLENIAVVILICIVSIFISNASVGIALLIGALLTIIEMAIIFTNIMWVEKTNISKSLKGGCL